MIRNLKALGLALCAVSAFGALSASVASAANDVLTSGSTSMTTFLTGTQIGGIKATPPNVFGAKSGVGTVECASASYKGSYTGTTGTSVELTPSYSECKIGPAKATVTDNGCKYVLTGTTHAYTNTSGGANGEDATAKLNCEDKASNAIVVDGPLDCVITFSDTHPAGTKVNQNLLGVKYDNESVGGIWAVTATVTLDKITYTSNPQCQSLGFTATDSDGFLTTTVTFKAYSDAAHTTQVNLTQS